MLILQEHFKTKMKKIRLLERMLHCVKIDKFKKMTLYIDEYKLYINYKLYYKLYQII